MREGRDGERETGKERERRGTLRRDGGEDGDEGGI